MMLYRILAFFFLIPGCGLVFAAKEIVKRFGLDKKQKCNFEGEMSEEEIEQYKFNHATVNLKMIGMLVAIPGFILIVIGFK